MSGNDKWVRRFSVDETAQHKNGFTIYKITSVLFPIWSPSSVTVVSVWKRYREVQALHAGLHRLHGALHLSGAFPQLHNNSWTFFKRFQEEVIESRASSIKALLEFIALHPLLFTSIQFVNFLQDSYPPPEDPSESVIREICSELQLPHDEVLLPSTVTDHENNSPTPTNNNDIADNVSNIQIFEGTDIERDFLPRTQSPTGSFESIDSMLSIDSDTYDEVAKMTINKINPSVKPKVLPDLINFDQPSTSFSYYQSGNYDQSVLNRDEIDSFRSDNSNFNSNNQNEITNQNERDNNLTNSDERGNNLISRDEGGINITRCDGREINVTNCDQRGIHSLNPSSSGSRHSGLVNRNQTEDSYIFEAGYMLNLAARCEEAKDYAKAFQYYKSGIEKLLIGVKSDSDTQRRILVKEKTQKYLGYAEQIYVNHLHDQDQAMLDLAPAAPPRPLTLPLAMLRLGGAALRDLRVLAVLGDSMLLVAQSGQHCRALKVIQRIPRNLTEFDDYLPKQYDTKEPILPTNIPYMVPLHGFIQTDDLIFLILQYAPGQKLLDYIKNYINSVPNTSSREVNLENVFSEPRQSGNNSENHKSKDFATNRLEKDNISNLSSKNNIDLATLKLKANKEAKELDINIDNSELEPKSTDLSDNDSLSVKEMVLNSQKLIQNVDLVLKEDNTSIKDDIVEVKTEWIGKVSVCSSRPLPPHSVESWSAQLLIAIQHLHLAGVILRDLNPNNILLGEKGQIILTYQMGYDLETMLCKLDRRAKSRANLYVAPEIYNNVFLDPQLAEFDHVCDFWSFGAILYELICGEPLSSYHSEFTSHTLLCFPEHVSLRLEETSILTQLLTFCPTSRLGAGGVRSIQEHPYYRNIHWEEMELNYTAH